MAYVVDRILGEVEIENDAGSPGHTTWQHATARAAEAFYDVLKSHPNALPLLLCRVPVGPNALVQARAHRRRAAGLRVSARSRCPRLHGGRALRPRVRLTTARSGSPATRGRGEATRLLPSPRPKHLPRHHRCRRRAYAACRSMRSSDSGCSSCSTESSALETPSRQSERHPTRRGGALLSGHQHQCMPRRLVSPGGLCHHPGISLTLQWERGPRRGGWPARHSDA